MKFSDLLTEYEELYGDQKMEKPRFITQTTTGVVINIPRLMSTSTSTQKLTENLFAVITELINQVNEKRANSVINDKAEFSKMMLIMKTELPGVLEKIEMSLEK